MSLYEVPEVDLIILMEMREKLSPKKEFSYKDSDHEIQAEEDEKRMRDATKQDR